MISNTINLRVSEEAINRYAPTHDTHLNQSPINMSKKYLSALINSFENKIWNNRSRKINMATTPMNVTGTYKSINFLT